MKSESKKMIRLTNKHLTMKNKKLRKEIQERFSIVKTSEYVRTFHSLPKSTLARWLTLLKCGDDTLRTTLSAGSINQSYYIEIRRALNCDQKRMTKKIANISKNTKDHWDLFMTKMPEDHVRPVTDYNSAMANH